VLVAAGVAMSHLVCEFRSDEAAPKDDGRRYQVFYKIGTCALMDGDAYTKATADEICRVRNEHKPDQCDHLEARLVEPPHVHEWEHRDGSIQSSAITRWCSCGVRQVAEWKDESK